MSSFPSDSTVEFDLTASTVDERLLVLSVVSKRPLSVPIDALTVVPTVVPRCPMSDESTVVTKRPMFEYLTAVPRCPLSDNSTVERILSDLTAVERCL